jgi:hypothetical protein
LGLEVLVEMMMPPLTMEVVAAIPYSAPSLPMVVVLAV